MTILKLHPPPTSEYFTQSSVHVDQGWSIFKMAKKVEGRP